MNDVDLRSMFQIFRGHCRKCTNEFALPIRQETVATGEGINIGKCVTRVYRSLLHANIDLFCVVDSKDQFTALTSQLRSFDRSIRCDNSVIRFEFEARIIAITLRISSNLNLADIELKFVTPQMPAVSQMISTRVLLVNIDNIESVISKLFSYMIHICSRKRE